MYMANLKLLRPRFVAVTLLITISLPLIPASPVRQPKSSIVTAGNVVHCMYTPMPFESASTRLKIESSKEMMDTKGVGRQAVVENTIPPTTTANTMVLTATTKVFLTTAAPTRVAPTRVIPELKTPSSDKKGTINRNHGEGESETSSPEKRKGSTENSAPESESNTSQGVSTSGSEAPTTSAGGSSSSPKGGTAGAGDNDDERNGKKDDRSTGLSKAAIGGIAGAAGAVLLVACLAGVLFFRYKRRDS